MRKYLLLPAILLSGYASVGAADSITLADKGATKYRIVVAADASDAEKYAAQELAAYLKKISSADFPIVNSPADGKDAGNILLQHDPAFGAEEYALKTTKRTLTITGGRPRGVLYGVYALLEEKLGCRWYTRDVERVVAQQKIKLKLDERFKPRLEYREPYCREAMNADWCARNRVNSSSGGMDAKHGGRVIYGTFVHTFNAILNPEVHFKAHPEYFALVKGKRLGEYTQLCLTNPDVLKFAIARVHDWIKDNPQATIFSVSQNDWHNWCECERCKAVDDEEGSHAGTMIRFVNGVAAAFEKSHPHIAIDTLAYQYTRKPPKLVKPRSNVIVRLCSIECCFSHPLDGCSKETNTAFMADLRGWNKLTSRLYIWDYVTNFQHYVMPNPNLDALDDNIRTFADNGVAGIFEQGNYSGGGGGELAELRAWVLAKLLWNPSASGDALIKEYIDGVYGVAAVPVQAFIQSERDAIKASDEHVHIYDGPHREFMRPELLRKWDDLLELAEKAALDSGDAQLIARVQRLRQPVWYAIVQQNLESLSVRQRAGKRLLDTARMLKVSEFHEGQPIQNDFNQLELLLARKEVTLEPGHIAIEDAALGLYKPGDLTGIVADPKADDGVAAWLTGRTTEWAISWSFASKPGVLGKKFLLRARVRAEKTGETGGAFHGGVYDHKAKREWAHGNFEAKQVSTDYLWFDIGVFEANKDSIIYLAPNDNGANIKRLLIDRVELVPKE